MKEQGGLEQEIGKILDKVWLSHRTSKGTLNIAQGLQAILELIRSRVPVRAVYDDGTPRDKDWEGGWNMCREVMLKELGGDKS